MLLLSGRQHDPDTANPKKNDKSFQLKSSGSTDFFDFTPGL
jgi:hypothetical protein